MRSASAGILCSVLVLLVVLACNVAFLASLDRASSRPPSPSPSPTTPPPKCPDPPGDDARVRALTEEIARLRRTSATTSPNGTGGPDPRDLERLNWSAHDKHCDETFGWGLVEAIRSRQVRVCPGGGAGEDGAAKRAKTKMTCWNHHGRYSSQPAAAYCEMTNVAAVGELMQTGKISGPAGEDGHILFHRGAIRPAFEDGCPEMATSFKRGGVQVAKPYTNLYESLEGKVGQDAQCEEWVEQPVVVATRMEWAHLLFSACETLNIFAGLRVAGIDPREARVLLLDTHPTGPFFEFYEAQSLGGPVLRAEQLFGLKSPQKRTVCFRKLLVSLPGYSGFLVDAAVKDGTTCRNSPLLRAVRNSVLSHVKLLDSPAYPSHPVVTFISRRPYAHEGFNKKTIGRVVNNEKEVTDAARAALSPARGQFEFVDLAPLTLREQLRVVRGTNILFGMHGAGLVHSLFLPDDSAVVEVFPGSYPENLRDRNIARHMGHAYLAYELSDPTDSTVRLDIPQFLSVLDKAVHVARSSFGQAVSRCGLKC